MTRFEKIVGAFEKHIEQWTSELSEQVTSQDEK